MNFTYNVILLAIAFDQKPINNQNRYVHSHFQKWFYNHLSELERRRRQRQIPLSALLLPSQSACRRAYYANCYQAMITLTGLDCVTFAFILQDFKYTGSAWENGKIYDPNSGKTYDCILKVKDNNKVLDIRGYVGVPMFGRTATWTRS